MKAEQLVEAGVYYIKSFLFLCQVIRQKAASIAGFGDISWLKIFSVSISWRKTGARL